MKNIIFIGGIHGVGKTTFCKKILKNIDANHYSAGSLIKRMSKELISDKDKKVSDIDKNQDRLIVAIDKYVEEMKPSLLDGHFCLLNQAYEIEGIQSDIFLKIHPKVIIVLHDSIDNIQERNSKRDGILYNSELLLAFQNRELEYSKEIAKKLDIPYKVFDVNDNPVEALKFIKKSL